MNKKLTYLLLLLLGVVILLAQTTRSEVKLFATKVELNGQVKLSWTKPAGANNTTVYSLYRQALPDTAATLVKSGADTSFVDQVPPVVSAVPRSYAYRVSAKTGVLTELSNIIIVPVPSIPLVGSFRLEGKIDSGKVKLSWDVPPVGTVSYYLVFGSAGDPLVKIDSTTGRTSVSPVPAILPGTKVLFTFVVRAKLTTGEMLQSTAVSMMVENKLVRDEVKFVSLPPPVGLKGVPYLYAAKAVSNDPSAVIRYFPEMHDNASVNFFTIDSVTGAINWVPAQKGLFRIEIEARSSKGGKARQEFVVAVAGGNGIIQGKVTDTTNAPVPNVIIEAYKKENNFQFSYAYNVKTDLNGNYRLVRVDPGTYFLRANSPSSKFQSQWYDGKFEVSKADSVIVIDSPAVSVANFKLRGAVRAGITTTVTGTVKDTNGLAINGADTRVIFVRAEFALNGGSSTTAGLENFRKYFDYRLGDFRMEGNSEFVIKTKTDSIGNYTVKLPAGAYIALSRANGYAVEFYKEQSSLLSAVVLKIANDTSGINFTLSPLPPVVLGAITGTVSDSVKAIPVPARVIAFRDGWRSVDPLRVGRSYVTDTDSLGVYKFTDLLPGTYIVMAVPLGSYVPAFYSADTASTRWKKATKITVSGNSVDNINIYVRPFGLQPSGYTGIAGNVNLTGNGSGNPLNRAGSIVYAVRNGDVAGYAVTNDAGSFAIYGLAPGSYTVYVDKAGFNESLSQSVNASYTSNGVPQFGLVNFTVDGTLGVTEQQTSAMPQEYALAQNYPNPFNPSTTINYSLPVSGNVTLKIYNVVGQEVATLTEGFRTAGSYTATFTANHLSSGVYFYRLQSASASVVKKMMLLK